jgi:hypothetical protein
MTRLYLFIFCLSSPLCALFAQNQTVSIGLFTGITATHTWDTGIDRDARYSAMHNLRFAPISINYSLDYEGFGFFINPGLVNIGQNFQVVNTSGGYVGTRKVHQQYLNIPLAIRLHLIDLDFFRLSLVGGGSMAFLLDGSEKIGHDATRLRFPSQVYPLLPSDYSIEYDGVATPAVDDYTLLQKRDFRSYQVFALLGFRADWDVSDAWRISADVRVNYGILDPRSPAYLEKLNRYETLYDLPGRRHDTYALVGIGVSRYFSLADHANNGRKQTKGTPKRKNGKNPWPGPRRKKPRS